MWTRQKRRNGVITTAVVAPVATVVAVVTIATAMARTTAAIAITIRVQSNLAVKFFGLAVTRITRRLY